MSILGFGTYDRARHPRIAVVLAGLEEHGDHVCEANAPLDLSTEDKVEMLRRPWSLHRLLRRLPRCWVAAAGQAWRCRRSRATDAVIVGYMGHLDVLIARLLFPGDHIVLDLMIFASDTAADRRLGGRTVRLVLGLLDHLAVMAATTVMVDTGQHLELLPERQRGKGIVVPVGAERAWFQARRPRDQADPDRAVRVVFYGLFTPLQGAPVVGEALALLGGCDGLEFTMIGTGQERASARSRATGNPRVTWVDWVPSHQLPTVVAAHDVCLGIFGTSAKARRVVPNKVYQGAAAGCAVITSDTPPQREALGDAGWFVTPGDASALAHALRQLAGDRPQLRRLQEAAQRVSDSRFTPGAAVTALRARLRAATSSPAGRQGWDAVAS
jgi:glycosyltransferase involved in cell wall biosynthesis